MGLEVTNSDEQTFALYRPTSFTHSCFVSHPDEIFETSSMSCLPPPKTGYQLNLCSQTILRGFLTNAQLEAISLACAQHDLRLHGTGERAAFFLGDGPGVGKGRQAAGIIFENFLRGRRKGLWLSASPDLVADARRDLNDIGAENVACWNLKDYPLTVKLDDPRKWDEDRLVEGCLFCTYTLLTSDRDVGKRIDQIVEWCGGESFDGPVILDECHKAKNLGSGRVSSGNGGRGRGRKNKEKDDLGDSNAWGNKATKAATFVAELQERLPLARIVYVSATGASEPKHFMQLSRLGLWGSGTSFKDAEDFVENIQKGGVGDVNTHTHTHEHTHTLSLPPLLALLSRTEILACFHGRARAFSNTHTHRCNGACGYAHESQWPVHLTIAFLQDSYFRAGPCEDRPGLQEEI